MGKIDFSGVKIMKSRTLIVEVPAPFGWFRWRLHIAGILIRLAVWALRCNVEFRDKPHAA